MADMLVKLYGRSYDNWRTPLTDPAVTIKRAHVVDKRGICGFVAEHFKSDGWVAEAEAALHNQPPSLFIAERDNDVVGFACYDATAKGFFGPTGVDQRHRGRGIGGALLLRSLAAMKELGYGYAIIGWVAPLAIPLYEREAGAILIPDSEVSNSVYQNLIGR